MNQKLIHLEISFTVENEHQIWGKYSCWTISRYYCIYFPWYTNTTKMNDCIAQVVSERHRYMSSVMIKPDFCLCENKGADQLCSNCETNQRLCYRYTDSTISLILKSEISSF